MSLEQPLFESPLHALGLAAKARAADASCGVWANEVPHFGYIVLRGNSADNAFTSAASAALGFALPVEPCSVAKGPSARVLWHSPDEWLIVIARANKAGMLAALTDNLAGVRHQAVDNSSGYTMVKISGRDSGNVLSHCTVYDLAKLGEGRAVGTTFGRSSVVLQREGGSYTLILRRSFADYIWRFLERAAEPYRFGVQDVSAETAP